MQGRDSEDVWSRFVFELVIWPKEVTLVSRTQPSGPLCLWQCFFLFFMSKYFLTNPFLELQTLHILLHRLLWGNGGDRFHLAGSPAICLGYTQSPVPNALLAPWFWSAYQEKLHCLTEAFRLIRSQLKLFSGCRSVTKLGRLAVCRPGPATNSDTWIGAVTRWQFKAVSKINIHQIQVTGKISEQSSLMNSTEWWASKENFNNTPYRKSLERRQICRLSNLRSSLTCMLWTVKKLSMAQQKYSTLRSMTGL